MQKKERLNSAIERADSLQSKFDELQKQNADREEQQKIKSMEDKGEYDKIMADMNAKLESSEKKSKQWDEYQTNRRETLLSALPEEDRTVYDKLPLTELEFHVSKVSTKPSPASVDNSKPTSTGGYASFEEWASVDPKGYKKANDPQSSGGIKIGYGGD
tara:strand:- start:650 stop:1126 length:477 start_codon:yes stop_codon:yes gene_type:complete